MSDKSDVVCCMVEDIGLLIGKMVYDGEKYGNTLKNPRAVQSQTPDKGKAQLRLGELIGKPTDLFFSRPPVFRYTIKDQKIRDLYMQSTTNLILPNTSGGN